MPNTCLHAKHMKEKHISGANKENLLILLTSNDYTDVCFKKMTKTKTDDIVAF